MEKSVSRRRHRLIYLLLAILAGMLALHTSLRVLLAPERVAATVRQQLESSFRETEVQVAGANYEFPLSVALTGVKLTHGDEPLADIPSLRVAVSFPDLLRGRITITTITIEQPTLHLVQRDGVWNWADRLPTGEGGRPVRIDQLAISRGTVAIAVPGREWQLAVNGALTGLQTAPFRLADGNVSVVERETGATLRLKGSCRGDELVAEASGGSCPGRWLGPAFADLSLESPLLRLTGVGNRYAVSLAGAIAGPGGSLPFTGDAALVMPADTTTVQLESCRLTSPGLTFAAAAKWGAAGPELLAVSEATLVPAAWRVLLPPETRPALSDGKIRLRRSEFTIRPDTGGWDLEARLELAGDELRGEWAGNAVRLAPLQATLAGQYRSAQDSAPGSGWSGTALVHGARLQHGLVSLDDWELRLHREPSADRTTLALSFLPRVEPAGAPPLRGARLYLDGDWAPRPAGSTLTCTLGDRRRARPQVAAVLHTGSGGDFSRQFTATLALDELNLGDVFPYLPAVQRSTFNVTRGIVNGELAVDYPGDRWLAKGWTNLANGAFSIGSGEWAEYRGIDGRMEFQGAFDPQRKSATLQRLDLTVNDALRARLAGTITSDSPYWKPDLTVTAGPLPAATLMTYLPLAWRQSLDQVRLTGRTGFTGRVTPAALPGEFTLSGVLTLQDCGLRAGDRLLVEGISGSLPVDQTITRRYLTHDTSAAGYQYQEHPPNVSVDWMSLGGAGFHGLNCYAGLKDNVFRIDRLAFTLAEGVFQKGGLVIDFRADQPRFAALFSFAHLQLGPLYRETVGGLGELQGGFSGNLSLAWAGDRIENCRGEITADSPGRFSAEVLKILARYADPPPDALALALIGDYNYNELTIRATRIRARTGNYTDVLLALRLAGRELLSELRIEAPLKPLIYYLRGDQAALDRLRLDVEAGVVR